MVKITNVKMAAMKNMPKNEKIRISITQWLLITDKQNWTMNICFLWVENAIKLVNSCLLIMKMLKIQDGCQQNISATDVPFLLMF